jgi:hypothetical protein
MKDFIEALIIGAVMFGIPAVVWVIKTGGLG